MIGGVIIYSEYRKLVAVVVVIGAVVLGFIGGVLWQRFSYGDNTRGIKRIERTQQQSIDDNRAIGKGLEQSTQQLDNSTERIERSTQQLDNSTERIERSKDTITTIKNNQQTAREHLERNAYILERIEEREHTQRQNE